MSGSRAGGIIAGVEVIAQRVRTTWSKRSRGIPGSAVRNAVPTAFSLPSGLPPLFHDIVMNEDDGFTPHATAVYEAPRPFGLRLVGDALLVRVPDGFGAPVRTHRPTVTLRRGEWVRWQLNDRYSSATGRGDWRYTLTTLSIAFGPVEPDAFLGEAPHVVDERAGLR